MKLKIYPDNNHENHKHHDTTEGIQKIVSIMLEFGIPIVKTIPKQTEKARISFMANSKTKTLCQILTNKSKTFETQADLYRAIFDLGTRILYKMFRDEATEKSTVGESIFKQLDGIDKGLKEFEILDTGTRAAKMAYDRGQINAISKRQVDRLLKDIITDTPCNLQQEIKKRIKKIKAGEGIYQFETDNLVGNKQ